MEKRYLVHRHNISSNGAILMALLGSILEPSWGVLEASWKLFGHLEAISERLGPDCAALVAYSCPLE
eukprot:6724697-Pyramimonas_sp.AAC.1